MNIPLRNSLYIMNRILTLIVLTFTFPLLTQAQRVKGSDTVLPLAQKEAEVYMKKHPDESVTITGGGSGVGITALLEGTTDIAQLSRKIKFDEVQKLKSKDKEIVEVIIAYDALAVINHPSNTVNKLTREQLEGIFRGKLKNWKELGGPDLKIVPYSRETSSGTYEFFKESALRYKNYMNGIMSMPASGSVIQSISQTKGAIGYVGLAYINKSVQAIEISYDKGQTYANPLDEGKSDVIYPIVRPLYFYYIKTDEEKIKPFLDFVLSKEGQDIAFQQGFIKVK